VPDGVGEVDGGVEVDGMGEVDVAGVVATPGAAFSGVVPVVVEEPVGSAGEVDAVAGTVAELLETVLILGSDPPPQPVRTITKVVAQIGIYLLRRRVTITFLHWIIYFVW
jgi:hypothetical protein